MNYEPTFIEYYANKRAEGKTITDALFTFSDIYQTAHFLSVLERRQAYLLFETVIKI